MDDKAETESKTALAKYYRCYSLVIESRLKTKTGEWWNVWQCSMADSVKKTCMTVKIDQEQFFLAYLCNKIHIEQL